MAKRLALLIGTGSYDDDRIGNLSSPTKDIEQLSGVLRDPNIGGFDAVEALLDQTDAVVRRAIGQFFKDRRGSDLLLLYFAGHGMLDEYGLLYLVAKDTDKDLLDSTAVQANWVNLKMDLCTSRSPL